MTGINLSYSMVWRSLTRALLRQQASRLVISGLIAATLSAIGCDGFPSSPQRRNSPIPAAEIHYMSGSRFDWRVPDSLNAILGYETAFQIMENGHPLPFRVEHPELVEKFGSGRFGTLAFSRPGHLSNIIWLSASDNTDPSLNGREYNLVLLRTSTGNGAIWFMAAFCVLLTATTLVVVVRKWWVPPKHRRNWRGVSTALIAFGLLAYTQTFAGVSAQYSGKMVQGRIAHDSTGSGEYRLPKWLLPYPVIQHGVITENGRLLRWVPFSAWNSDRSTGVFTVSHTRPSVVRFRPFDGSNPSTNNKTYYFSAPVLPPELAAFLGLLLLTTGLAAGLYTKSPSLPKERRVQTLGSVSHRGWARDNWWVFLVALIAVIKLAAIWRFEILTQDFDAVDYASSAIHLVWGRTGLASGPAGFPMVAGIIARLGIPWRLEIEFLFLASSFLLARAMKLLSNSGQIGVLIFFALAFHPWTLSGFNEFMPYPLVLVVTIALLGTMFDALQRPWPKWHLSRFITIGLLLFLWQWSRTEDPLVYITYGVFAMVALVLSGGSNHPSALRRRIFLLAVPVLVTALLTSAVSFANYARYGISARSVTSQPGLMALMRALYRIRPSENIQFAPVTRHSLEEAAVVSPTLRHFEKALLDSTTSNVRVGELFTKRQGEFGPWLNWVLTIAVKPEPMEGNRVLLAAADEVTIALDRGIIPSRRASFPLDPEWTQWLPNLYPRFLAAVSFAIQPMPAKPRDLSANPLLNALFDRAANRRKVFEPGRAPSAVPVIERRESLMSVTPLPVVTPILAFAVGIFIFVAALWYGRAARSAKRNRQAVGCLIIICAVGIGRAALYAVLDANVGWSVSRYMPLLSPLFAVFVAVSGLVIGHMIQVGWYGVTKSLATTQ